MGGRPFRVRANGSSPISHLPSPLCRSNVIFPISVTDGLSFPLVHSDVTVTPAGDLELLAQLAQARVEMAKQISRRIVGQHVVVDNMISAILAGGHVLLVGVPGLAKTLLIQTIAQALDLQFSRISSRPT